MHPRTVNRLTASVTIVLLFGLAVVLGLLTPQTQRDLNKRPSTFFTDPSGARGLFLAMHELLPSVEQWRRPLTALRLLSSTNQIATLIVAGPGHPLSSGEAEALLTWLEGGGQLLLLTTDGWRIQAGKHAPPSPTNTNPSTNLIVTNTFLGKLGVGFTLPQARGTLKAPLPKLNARATEVTVQTQPAPTWSGEYTPLGRGVPGTVAIEVGRGQGRVIALADPGFISNQALREGDNATWLLALCASRPGRVAFDEYHHGFGEARGYWELTLAFLPTPWGWCVLQWLAAGALYALLYRRRLGRIVDPPPAGLRCATDLVDARAGLFRAARAQPLAADLIVQQLAHQAGARVSQSADLLTFCQHQRDRHRTGPTAERFAELERLYRQCLQAQTTSEQPLLELGRTAGHIQQELCREP